MITNSSLSYAVDEVVSVLAYEAFFENLFQGIQLYTVKQSSGRREVVGSLGGLTSWEVKNEGQNVDADDITQQYEKTYTHVVKGKRFKISRELAEDQQWGLLEELSNEIGATAAYTMEVDAFAPLNNGFTTALVDDGLTLFNGAHVNSAGGNSQDNSDTQTLDQAGVNTSRTALRKQTNSRGLYLNITPDLIICPVDLEEAGWEVINSPGRPDTTNRSGNINPTLGWQLMVSRFLTDTNAWFMCDSMYMRRSWKWFQRWPLELFSTGDLMAGTKDVGATMRYINGPQTWLGCYGNNPS